MHIYHKPSILIKYLIAFVFFSFSLSSVLQAQIKIMPLGDSITWDWYYGDGRPDSIRHGYRNHLWYQLQNANYDVDFVGSLNNGGSISPSFDGDNEGYTGHFCHQIASNVYHYLLTNTPDIILLHIGTNGSASFSPSKSVADAENILNEIDRFERDKKVKITVILAQIINLQKNPFWINSYNSQLAIMAQNRITNGDDIILVNMQSAVGWDLIDGIHPTNSGYQKMATAWFNKLKPVLDNFSNDDYAYLIPIYNLILTP